MLGELYDKLSRVNLNPMREQLLELLHHTWAGISVDVCEAHALCHRPLERINRDDLARVELTSDDVRSAAFCNIGMWAGTRMQSTLDEWFELSLDEQNMLLIEAFPDGKVYGV